VIVLLGGTFDEMGRHRLEEWRGKPPIPDV
jgi:hypothetical protein